MENIVEHLLLCEKCGAWKCFREGVTVCNECKFTFEMFKQRVLEEKGNRIELSLTEANALLREKQRAVIAELRAALEETCGWVLTPEQYTRLGHALDNAAELRAHMTTVYALLERTKP